MGSSLLSFECLDKKPFFSYIYPFNEMQSVFHPDIILLNQNIVK